MILTKSMLPVATDWFHRVMEGQSIAAIARDDNVAYKRVAQSIHLLYGRLLDPRFAISVDDSIPDALMRPIRGFADNIPPLIRNHRTFFYPRLEKFREALANLHRAERSKEERRPTFLDSLIGITAMLVDDSHPDLKGDALASWFVEQWENESFRERFAKTPRMTKKRFEKVAEAIEACRDL